MGQIGCSETQVRNYRCALCNIPEERGSHLLRGGSLKSRVFDNFVKEKQHLTLRLPD